MELFHPEGVPYDFGDLSNTEFTLKMDPIITKNGLTIQKVLRSEVDPIKITEDLIIRMGKGPFQPHYSTFVRVEYFEDGTGFGIFPDGSAEYVYEDESAMTINRFVPKHMINPLKVKFIELIVEGYSVNGTMYLFK